MAPVLPPDRLQHLADRLIAILAPGIGTIPATARGRANDCSRRNPATPMCRGEGPLSTCAVTRRRFSSGCKPRPATAPAGSNRGRHGGDEMSEAPG